MKLTNRKTAIYLAISGILATSLNSLAEQEKQPDETVGYSSRESGESFHIYSAKDISRTGASSVAEFLRSISLNSFGSWKGISGYTIGASASVEIDLLGLGGTLVLVDGRRLPGAGYDPDGTQDLNNIMLNVVDRIEVSIGSGSAKYGAGALAGVVNIITKSEISDNQFTIRYQVPEVDGGEKNKLSVSYQTKTEKSKFLVFAEYGNDAHISDSAITGFDNAFSSYSPVANVYFFNTNNSAYTTTYNSELCQQAELNERLGQCQYAFSNDTWFHPEQKTKSFMAKYNYQIDDSLNLYSRLSLVNNTTKARFAGEPIGLEMQFNNPNNIYSDIMHPASNPIDISWRSTGLGYRDSNVRKDYYGMTMGLQGELDLSMKLNWDVSFQKISSTEQQRDDNLLNTSLVQSMIDTGTFDILNAANLSFQDWQQHVINEVGAAEYVGEFDADSSRDLIRADIDGTLYSNDTASINFQGGFEFERSNYTQKVDPVSASVDAISSGYETKVSSKGERISFQLELGADFKNGLFTSIGLRNDNYEQTGDMQERIGKSELNELSSSFMLGYEFSKSLLITASKNEGFKTPNVRELFLSSESYSVRLYDYYYCHQNMSDPYCDFSNVPIHTAYTGGNPGLKSEASESNSFDIRWAISNDMKLSANIFNVKRENVIGSFNLSPLLDYGVRDDLPNVVRDESGRIEYFETGYTNFGTKELSGTSLQFFLSEDFTMGELTLDSKITKLNSHKTNGTEYLDTTNAPDTRANVLLSLENEKYFASWNMQYISGQPETGFSARNIDSVTYHDLVLGLNLDWNAKVSLGVKNLTSEDIPSLFKPTKWRSFNHDLYRVDGRSIYLEYAQAF